MQHMQDKEFDELFRNRFDTAEIEPSVNLWSNIEEKLVVKRKRVFPVYWSAAAAIAVAVTVAVLFQKTDKMQSGTTAAITAQSGKEIASTEKDNTIISSDDNSDNFSPIKKEVVKERIASLQHNIEMMGRDADQNTAVIPVTDKATEKKDLLAMQPSVVISHLEYRETKVKQETVKLPKTLTPPVEEVMLASADVAADPVNGTDNDEALDENKRAESRGIRNMGDLINYVVDKVDKREEKFIQFKTDEDDNSSLIGLNIGMFKFSQKKHK